MEELAIGIIIALLTILVINILPCGFNSPSSIGYFASVRVKSPSAICLLLIHPAWDLLFDNHNLTSFVTQWYPVFYIGYHIVMSLYIALKCIKIEENNPFIN